jgi:hypothetical protein
MAGETPGKLDPRKSALTTLIIRETARQRQDLSNYRDYIVSQNVVFHVLITRASPRDETPLLAGGA